MKRKISRLIKLLPGEGIAGAYKNVIAELNAIAQKNWTWNYLHLVNSEKLKASPHLVNAIEKLYKKINTSPVTNTYELVLVLAPKGLIAENTILDIPPKECVRKACRKNFIPRAHNQKFCSPMCKELFKQ